MSMKKTDLEKHLAKKLEGGMKKHVAPSRFGKGSAPANDRAATDGARAATKLVTVSCRLPADLAHRLRERALHTEGGVSVLVARAVEQWLASAGKPAP